MKSELSQLFNARIEELAHYNPINFFREENDSFDHYVKKPIFGRNIDIESFGILVDGFDFIFLFKRLDWDSDFFGQSTIRLDYVLFDANNINHLVKAIDEFKNAIVKDSYIYIEIPSEDILLIQALNLCFFKMVETRMTYFLNLHEIDFPRFNVRNAQVDDIPNLKKTAIEMVNPYDRFHADVDIENHLADKFLGVFAEESIRGFADYVIVPNEDDLPADSFVTSKILQDDWGFIGLNYSKMVLSAVSAITNRGWYMKLIIEMAYLLKSKGSKYAIMHPASTNKAVIHTYEKLGCKLGKVTHILSYKK